MYWNQTRRNFIKSLSANTGTTLIPGPVLAYLKVITGSTMKMGLVTYLRAKDWDIPTIINNCSATGIKGVELRIIIFTRS